MTFIAISLVILSAGIHSLWNIFSKSKNPTPAFFLFASLASTVLLSPILFLHIETLLSHFPAAVWGLLVVAGFCMALYFVSLASAYRAGDLSIAYPIVRAIPVVIVLIVVVLLGRSDQVSIQSVFGALLIVFGCFIIPLKRFSSWHYKNYLNLTCVMAFIAALGTAGYVVVDDEALRYLRNDTNLTIDDTSLAILYACLESLITSIWLAIFVLLHQKSRLDISQVIRINIRQAIVVGIGMSLSYTLVLIALAFVDNVSYIVAFHRLSIPLVAALGIVILKEQPYKTKVTGIFVVLVGLVFVALG